MNPRKNDLCFEQIKSCIMQCNTKLRYVLGIVLTDSAVGKRTYIAQRHSVRAEAECRQLLACACQPGLGTRPHSNQNRKNKLRYTQQLQPKPEPSIHSIGHLHATRVTMHVHAHTQTGQSAPDAFSLGPPRIQQPQFPAGPGGTGRSLGGRPPAEMQEYHCPPSVLRAVFPRRPPWGRGNPSTPLSQGHRQARASHRTMSGLSSERKCLASPTLLFLESFGALILAMIHGASP